ncbi:MAG: hypothetical protein IID41_10955 [Planctomycetes bacterium]|nr:hypothetical protein [Planctomycetota bacterium]
MLRMPARENDTQVKKRLLNELKAQGLPDKEARSKASELFKAGSCERKLVDPALGKGGLVRDWNLRKIIRDCLDANGIDPDHFGDKQIADFVKSGKMRMPSGVPIKSVITIGPISDPVKIAVKDPISGRQAINPRTGEPVFRYHISRNNHHMTIREDIKTGKWTGEVTTMFDATQRVRRDKIPAVDRSDSKSIRFIMSLSEGETIHACRWDPKRSSASGAPGYFVVMQLNRKEGGQDTIEFLAHWDARPRKGQDRWSVTPSDLKNCGPESGRPPYKVRVSPLGKVTRLERD